LCVRCACYKSVLVWGSFTFGIDCCPVLVNLKKKTEKPKIKNPSSQDAVSRAGRRKRKRNHREEKEIKTKKEKITPHVLTLFGLSRSRIARGADRVGHRFVVSSLLSIDLIPICPVTRQERELCRNERNQRVPARGNRQAGNVWSRVVTNEIQSHEKAVSSNERIAIYVRTVHVDNNWRVIVHDLPSAEIRYCLRGCG